MSSFHILYPIHFLIWPRWLLVVYWPKPLYDLYLRTAYNITGKVLPGREEYGYLHIKPNCSLFTRIQRSYRKYHKWNISLFKILRLAYPDGGITSSSIAQGSHLPPTGKTTQWTTVIFHFQHTLYLIGVGVIIWTYFTPTLVSNHPLTVQDAQVIIFIGPCPHHLKI